MKKLLLLGVLLTGYAGAAGWEYGFPTEENGKIFGKPGSEKAVSVTGNKYGDVLATLKCKATTNDLPDTTFLGQLDFFDCVGARGWEYVGLKYLNSQSVTYIFKRPGNDEPTARASLTADTPATAHARLSGGMNGQTSDKVSGVPQQERHTDSKNATKT